jgi:hypothetical protein
MNPGTRLFALRLGVSLVLGAGAYWIIDRSLKELALLAGAESPAGGMLLTLSTFLSPGYLGLSVLIALASCSFVLISHLTPARGSDGGDRPPQAGAPERKPGQHPATPSGRADVST